MEPQAAKPTAPVPDAVRELLLLILGQHAAAVVATLVRFDLADRLSDGPWSAPELAADAGIDPSATLRLLRAAAALGLVDQIDDTTFDRNCRTDLLCRGAGSLRDVALAAIEPGISRPLDLLPDAMVKGGCVASAALGTDTWTYRDAHPHARMAMTERLLGLDEAVVLTVQQRIDLTTVRTIVAIGGGHGGFLAELLRHAPAACGILFDRPPVAAAAARTMAARHLADRVRCVGGDYLAKVPTGGDLYVLKGVLHDQDDDCASWLLDSCYMAALPHSRLVAVEGVLAEDGRDDPVARLIDIHSLVTVNGRERTAAEIEELFNNSGYVLESVTYLKSTSYRPVAMFIGRRS